MIITITKGELLYVAHCDDPDVVSQGSTLREVIYNLEEAISLYHEVMTPSKGIIEVDRGIIDVDKTP